MFNKEKITKAAIEINHLKYDFKWTSNDFIIDEELTYEDLNNIVEIASSGQNKYFSIPVENKSIHFNQKILDECTIAIIDRTNI